MRMLGAVPMLVALAVVGGCAVGSSSTQAEDARTLTDPLEQASSAVATTQIAVDQLGADRLTHPVADTALLDQVAVLDDAAFAVVTLVPTDATAAGWQQHAIAAVRDAQGAVVAARGWVNGAGGGQGTVTAALQASADQLDELTAELEDAS